MKQLYIISFLLFLIGFYGCYDDEGNYDYTEVFEIRIDSMKASYTLYTLVDTLRISPEVSPADAEYDFHWGVYQTMYRDMLRHWIPSLLPGTWSIR